MSKVTSGLDSIFLCVIVNINHRLTCFCDVTFIGLILASFTRAAMNQVESRLV